MSELIKLAKQEPRALSDDGWLATDTIDFHTGRTIGMRGKGGVDPTLQARMPKLEEADPLTLATLVKDIISGEYFARKFLESRRIDVQEWNEELTRPPDPPSLLNYFFLCLLRREG